MKTSKESFTNSCGVHRFARRRDGAADLVTVAQDNLSLANQTLVRLPQFSSPRGPITFAASSPSLLSLAS